MTRIFKIILPFLLVAINIHTASAQKFAVKTNVLMDAALTPNLSCEVVTGERTSLDISAFGHYHPYSIDSKLVGLQPEFRYWFSGRPMVREYVGIAGLATTYNMTWKDYVYNGDALGLGVTAGYSLALNKRWNIEFYGGVGFVWFQQKQYYKYDKFEDSFTDDSRKPNAYGYKLLPIKLGISISYIIK